MNDSIPSYPIRFSSGEKLRCIVIDDEPIARRGMALLIARHPMLTLETVLSGPREALDWLKSNVADLIFLDIEMPSIKGIDLAAQFPHDTMVVFTTAYSEYAARSYDLDAIDYLLKPINYEKIDRAVRKALLRIDAMRITSLPELPSTLKLRAERRFVNIEIDKIVFIEGLKDYIRLHTDSERIISRITLKALLEQLPAERFIRIHKSYIINVNCIKSYDSSTVILHYGPEHSYQIELPVGDAFRSNILPKL